MQKTNAMRLLDKLNIPYTPHEYSTADGALDGVSVAQKTGQNPARVFKTLVCRGVSGSIAVFCIPVAAELHLKPAARAAGEKSITMLPAAEVLPLTGYKRGGCSPLGMKKQYPTFIEHSGGAHETILVSGGQIGLQIEIKASDLLRAANAQWFGLEG